jgi:hypothetical protein
MSIAIQAEFARSLLKADLPPPSVIRSSDGADPERRFAVYRNNVVVGLVRALEARFPVVLRLVGEEFFRAMAQVYVTHDPPRSPILFRYGSTFPDSSPAFLRRLRFRSWRMSRGSSSLADALIMPRTCAPCPPKRLPRSTPTAWR